MSCAGLYAQKNYDAVHHYAAKALALSPDSETLYYWMYCALNGKNWKSQALEVIDSAEKHLPPDSYREFRRRIRERS